MFRKSNMGLLVLGLVFLGVGCSERQRVDQTARACDIALTPHDGEQYVDLEIRRFQEAAGTQPTRNAYLERLGWAYVAKSRTGNDPGFLTLAAQTAHCLAESKEPEARSSAALLRGHVLHQQHRFQEAETVAGAFQRARRPEAR